MPVTSRMFWNKAGAWQECLNPAAQWLPTGPPRGIPTDVGASASDLLCVPESDTHVEASHVCCSGQDACTCCSRMHEHGQCHAMPCWLSGLVAENSHACMPESVCICCACMHGGAPQTLALSNWWRALVFLWSEKIRGKSSGFQARVIYNMHVANWKPISFGSHRV